MKKLYSTIMMLAMMVAALGFISCGDDDEDDGEGGTNQSSASTIRIVSSDGREYVILNKLGSNPVGQLSPKGHIWCFVEETKKNSGGNFRINQDTKKSISDYYVGLDLGEVDMHLATQGDYNYNNLYYYDSGSIIVIANDGKSFTLRFDNYVAEHSSGRTMTVNGTLYVEDELILHN